MSVSVENALPVPYRIIGNRKETITNVTFDSKYLSEGETLTKANLGFSSFIDSARCNIKAVGGSVNVAEAFFDKATELIHLFDETPGEVASEADVSNIVVQVTARGV